MRSPSLGARYAPLMGGRDTLGFVSDDLRAVLAALTPSARAMLRRILLHDADKPGTSRVVMVFGHEEEGDDYLLDDLVYTINRGTLDPSERLSIVEILNEIDAEGTG
jgi:hypothetical protein